MTQANIFSLKHLQVLLKYGKQGSFRTLHASPYVYLRKSFALSSETKIGNSKNNENNKKRTAISQFY